MLLKSISDDQEATDIYTFDEENLSSTFGMMLLNINLYLYSIGLKTA